VLTPADAEICRRAALHAVALDTYDLRPAWTVSELAAACSLVHDAYVGLGICAPKPTGMLVSPQHLASDTVVFLARRRADQRLVGTVSVLFDGPAGLPLDHDYPVALSRLRADSARLCEIGSLAVTHEHRRSGANALLAMASLWAALHAGVASHCVIGVHPRAADHYRALYGFRRFGDAQRHCELQAPVTGLELELATLEAYLRRAHPRPMSSGRRVHEHTCHELPACIAAPRTSRAQPRLAAASLRRQGVEHAAHG
jgi:hypothetical protein